MDEPSLTSSHRGCPREGAPARRRRLHLALAGALVAVTAALVPAPVPGDSWPARLLVGWVVGALSFALPVLRRAHRLDADETGAVFEGAEGGRTETDVIVVPAAFASLVAVAVMRVVGQSPPSTRTFEAVLRRAKDARNNNLGF